MTAARSIEAPGFDQVSWGGWCPVQAMGWVDGCAIYFRARGSAWRIEIGRGPEVTEYETPAHVAWAFSGTYGDMGDAGWMCDADVRWCIHVAVAVWRSRGGRSGPAGVVTLRAPFVPAFDPLAMWSLPAEASR